MSGLVLKLSPKERILVNGAVIENGDRRSRLSIMTPDANILRLKDAIHPKEAKTPVRRLCFAVQLVLTGDSKPEHVDVELLEQISELESVFLDAASRDHLRSAKSSIRIGNHYKCLKSLRRLIEKEEVLLSL